MFWINTNYTGGMSGVTDYVADQETATNFKNELVRYNPKDVEIIGIQDAILLQKVKNIGDGYSPLTQTTQFYTAGDWYTLRADSARIKLTNSTGNTQYIRECSIRAKLVYRFSGAMGYIHDAFVNYDDILLNGERFFKLQNNMICNVTQINQLADYWWKVHKTKKHVYSITLPGTRHWYKLGLWYTLQIGGAGEAEYIDSTVKLVGKSVEQTPGTLGKTTLTFLEVEENWKFDSSEVARYIASGVPLRGLTGGNVITVASQYYMGTADFYCDGTADQTEIQEAIDWLVDTYGGGTVHLTRGQFNITAAIELDSNIIIEGEGAETVIEKNCNDYAIESVGSSGSEKENVVIQNLKVTRNAADTNNINLVYLYYSDNTVISTCYFYDSYYAALYCSYSKNLIVNNNTFDIWRSTIPCISVELSSGNINGNYITGNKYTDAWYAIYCGGNNGIVVSNNIIENIYSVGVFYGIGQINGNNTSIINNKIINCHGTQAIGIQITGGSKSEIKNNIITNIYKLGSTATIYDTAIQLNGTPVGTHIVGNSCADNGNVIKYGNCEDATNPPQIDGNTATNTSAARSDVQEYEGDYSYKITKTNAAGTAASYWFVDNNTTTDMHGTVIKQGSYRLGLWVYIPSTGGPAAGEISISADEYSAAAWNAETDTATVQDEWEYLEATVELNSATTGFRCGLVFASTAAINEYVYIDNVRLTPMGVGNEHNNNFYDGGTNTIIG